MAYLAGIVLCLPAGALLVVGIDACVRTLFPRQGLTNLRPSITTVDHYDPERARRAWRLES